MFTNKHSRREKENGRQYSEPFNEPDAEALQKPTERSGYMAELEGWLIQFVFQPIESAILSDDDRELQIALHEGMTNVKRKVIESYHNGLKTNQSRNQKSYGQSSYRRN